MIDHDGHDDTTERGARGHDAESKGTTLEKPGRDVTQGWVEDKGGAGGGDDALGDEELIILGGYGRHHETEDVEESTDEKDVAGPISVVVFTDDRSEEEHTWRKY